MINMSLAPQTLLTHTKSVLSSALKVWPSAAVKVNYISKLLSNSAHHNIDPPPTLLTGLDVMNTLVHLQPEKMVQECGAELVLMMEPCFASKHHQTSQRLGSVLVKLYEAMGEPKQEQPNQQLMVYSWLQHVDSQRTKGDIRRPLFLNTWCWSMALALSRMLISDFTRIPG